MEVLMLAWFYGSIILFGAPDITEGKSIFQITESMNQADRIIKPV